MDGSGLGCWVFRQSKGLGRNQTVPALSAGFPFGTVRAWVGADHVCISLTVCGVYLPTPLASMERGKEMPCANCHLSTLLLLVCDSLPGRWLRRVWIRNRRDSKRYQYFEFCTQYSLLSQNICQPQENRLKIKVNFRALGKKKMQLKHIA